MTRSVFRASASLGRSVTNVFIIPVTRVMPSPTVDVGVSGQPGVFPVAANGLPMLILSSVS